MICMYSGAKGEGAPVQKERIRFTCPNTDAYIVGISALFNIPSVWYQCSAWGAIAGNPAQWV